MTSTSLQGEPAPKPRAFRAPVVLLMGCMMSSARISRVLFFGGVFFVFITTTKLEVPLFFSFDKALLILSLVFWLASPAPIVGIYRGSLFMRAVFLRREHIPVAAMLLVFAVLKAYDMTQRIALDHMNILGIFGYLLQEAPYALLPVMFFVHAKSTRDMELSVNIALCAIAISSLVALGIYFDLSKGFVGLRNLLVPPNSLYPEMGQLPFRHHQAGLSASAYTFSYHLSLAIPVAFFAILRHRTLLSKSVHVALLFLFLAALGVVGTRMPVIGCVAAILFGYSRIAKFHWRHFLGVGLAGSIVVAMFAAGGLAVQERFQSENLALDFLDKFWAQIAAFLSLSENPWGVGYGNVEDNSYINALNTDIRLVHLPHFHFITSVLFWGFPGLILSAVYCWSLWSVFGVTAAKKRIRQADPSRRLMAVAGVAGLLSVIINSMAHNPGPFFGDYTSWLSLGWIVAATSEPGRDGGLP